MYLVNRLSLLVNLSCMLTLNVDLVNIFSVRYCTALAWFLLLIWLMLPIKDYLYNPVCLRWTWYSLNFGSMSVRPSVPRPDRIINNELTWFNVTLCPKTWPIYIVCSSFPLNISSIYIIPKQMFSQSTSNRVCFW